MLNLIISGERKDIAAQSAEDLLAALSLPADGRGIAIAINDAVVPRSKWPEQKLADGDRIEIVRAVQGG